MLQNRHWTGAIFGILAYFFARILKWLRHQFPRMALVALFATHQEFCDE